MFYSIVHMPPRTSLGELELVVLLGLVRVGEGAYAAAIREEIKTRTGRTITPGAIYPTLDRLESRGLVRSEMGDPAPVRGGRARRHFSLTRAGVTEAQRAWRQLATLVAGHEHLFESGRHSCRTPRRRAAAWRIDSRHA
jgi:PadR family transcriptional regulator, regulatory protein PadR